MIPTPIQKWKEFCEFDERSWLFELFHLKNVHSIHSPKLRISLFRTGYLFHLVCIFVCLYMCIQRDMHAYVCLWWRGTAVSVGVEVHMPLCVYMHLSVIWHFSQEFA